MAATNPDAAVKALLDQLMIQEAVPGIHYLQQLLDDGVLTEKEFSEQKRDILDFLHKISSWWIQVYEY